MKLKHYMHANYRNTKSKGNKNPHKNEIHLFKLQPDTHVRARVHTHTQPFCGSLGFCPRLPGWAGTRKVKPGR